MAAISTRSVVLKALEKSVRHLPVPGVKADEWARRKADYADELIEQVARPEAQLYLDFALAKGDVESVTRERAIWHVRRLSGFGGSDMGVLFTNYQGGVTPFADVLHDRAVIAQKLLIELPTPAAGEDGAEDRHQMIRGNVFEGPIEQAFLRGHREFGLRPDTEGRERLRAWHAERAAAAPETLAMPWLQGSPDGLYLDRFGKRWLVDFKAPSDESGVRAHMSEIPQFYEGQLLHYALILREAGIPADHVALAPFSWSRMRVERCSLAVTDEKLALIERIGDHYYYDHLLRLELPKPRFSNTLVRLEEMDEKLAQRLRKLVATRKSKRWAEGIEETLGALIEQDLQRAGIDPLSVEGTVDLGIMRGARRQYRSIDTVLLKHRAHEAGVDVADESLYRTSEKFVLSTPRSKNSPHLDAIAGLGERAERAGEDLLMDLEEDGFEL
ncbi:hypothetical protein J2T57_001278 [Natronocella acetinitrilica]|uniref:PD-(D/E)XK endonuclease-like domain-containing protein n=1 Tax=Natronocella acetinitrilica TaxID=414046 RepID=A0AAE3G1U8_9GAMM|nr:hypothetical protein [Natronocella acetinitrilica]MCP1674176.1 hypothetical protein [Natronocella acetinitrilica]